MKFSFFAHYAPLSPQEKKIQIISLSIVHLFACDVENPADYTHNFSFRNFSQTSPARTQQAFQ